MRKVFLAKIEELHKILEWIGKCVEKVQFDARQMNQLEVACEEAVVNIIRHSSSEVIEVEVNADRRVEIAFKDLGIAFNPLERKGPDESLSIEEREIGGLGIHLMRQCMDEVHYRREGDANILVLVKRY